MRNRTARPGQKSLSQSSALTGAQEIRYEPIYDTLTITAGAITSVYNKFFLVPEGQSGKLKSDTNMTNSGILPKPQSLAITQIRAEAFINTPADWDFLVKLHRDCYIDFFVGVKSYLKVPFEAISGKMDVYLNGTKNDGATPKFLGMFGKPSETGYNLPRELLHKISANENFYVELQGNVSHTLAANAKIRIYLEGIRRLDVR